MADIKNTFIKGKMNKDLDSRVVPEGEYREGTNIQILNSEGSDVGAVQSINSTTRTGGSSDLFTLLGASTVKGAVKLIDLTAASEIIGDTNALTDGTYTFCQLGGGGTVGWTQITSGNGWGTGLCFQVVISSKAIVSVTATVSGSDFLNFPNIIQVTSSLSNGMIASGSTVKFQLTLTEDHIRPYNPNVIGFYINNTTSKFYWFVTNYEGNAEDPDERVALESLSNFCGIYELEEGGTDIKCLVKGAFLNFSQKSPIYNINMVDDLLFWTDNRNQPRKINVETAKTDATDDLNPTFYTTEEQISVAKYYPWKAPRIIKDLTTYATGNFTLSGSSTAFTLNYTNNHSLAVDNTTTLYFTISNTLYRGVVSGVSDSGSAFTVTIGQLYNDASGATASANITSSTELSFISTDTSMIEATGGSNVDTNYLKERFVKFAYRFKFNDNEYSLLSPFSQACFIPEFYKPSSAGDPPNLASGGIDGASASDNEELDAIKSTDLAKMINYVNQLDLHIDLEHQLKDLYTKLHVTHIEIVMSEANNSTLRSIVSKNIKNDTTTKHSIFSHTYKSTLPYKVLPEREITRVFDNVPVKAGAQEITGNRLIYGNITLGQSIPSGIDYTIGTTTRSSRAYNLDKEYPTQSLKQRRTYQVGLVLADKYGRQSSVILPTTSNNTIYKVEEDNLGDSNDTGYDDGVGYCLTTTFNSPINAATLYNATSNPLGWYSYKIVVKQTEQEYYNVYGPGLIKDWPDGNRRTWLTLHGDNVNKVPRSLEKNANPDIDVSPSEAILFPKVVNTESSGTFSNSGTVSSFKKLKVISIGPQKDHALFETGTTLDKRFYEKDKNHLLAEMVNSFGIDPDDFEPSANGGIPWDNDEVKLCVLETEPFESALDIYYETSTTGLITDLNTTVSTGASIASIDITNNSFPESTAANTFTNIKIEVKDPEGTVVSDATVTAVITDKDGNAVPTTGSTNALVVAQNSSDNNKYTLKVVGPWYYNNDGNTKKFTLDITATKSSDTVTGTFDIYLSNVDVVLVNSTGFSPTSPKLLDATISSGVTLTTATGDNGTAISSLTATNLSYSIDSVRYPAGADGTGGVLYTSSTSPSPNAIFGLFSINATSGVLTTADEIQSVGNYDIDIKVIDLMASQIATDDDTEIFRLTVSSPTTKNFWFMAHVDDNDQDNDDPGGEHIYKGFEVLNSRGSIDGCISSSSVRMHIGWNYPTADHTNINHSSNCFGGNSGVWRQGLLLPDESSTSDSSTHKYYQTITYGGNSTALHSLKSEEEADYRLLSCHEYSSDIIEDGNQDIEIEFKDIYLWIDDSTLVNAIAPTTGSPTKKVKITLTEENPSGTGDRILIQNLYHESTATNKPTVTTLSQGGKKVQLNKFKVDGISGHKSLTEVIEGAATYQHNNSNSNVAYSAYAPQAYSILGVPGYGGAQGVAPKYMMREKYIYNLKVEFEDV